ncbi:MAG: InlB B-repeat-containing protein [Eubacterium sp.]|nr:InlB B-repeat-containing protein [Eubacterium sp.]
MKRKVRNNRRRVMAWAMLILFVAWSFMGVVSVSGPIALAAGEDEAASGAAVSAEEETDPVEENAGPEETPEPEATPEPAKTPDGIYDEATLKAAFEKGGEVQLEYDIGMEEALTFSDGGKYFLDLNGHSLSRIGERDGKTYNEGGEVIHISGGSSLEIVDSASGNGMIYGGAAETGGGIMIEDGTLRATDITIRDNFSPKGGAIYVRQGSATLSGVTLEQNGVTEEGEVSEDEDDDSYSIFSFFFWAFGGKPEPDEQSNGGAIYAEDTASVNIDGCNILANKASNGGAIYNRGSVSITNSHIKQNYAYNDGGAILNTGRIELSGSQVNENNCEGGGGGLFHNNSTPLVIDDCDFMNNHGGKGGAIYCLGGNLTLTDCEFKLNEAKQYGGGICANDNITVSLKNVKADENHTTDIASAGGFGYFKGNLELEDCEIIHGSAFYGGAIHMSNKDSGGRITLKGGRIYIYENTDLNGANRNIHFYSFKKIKIRGKLEKGSFIGLVLDGAGDLTDDYSDYNNASPEEVFCCDHPDYTIQIDEDYAEVKAKKLLKATNSGYKCNVFIDVTDDADHWDYCYVYVYGKPKNGRGKEKLVWSSSDIKKYVDHSDGYWSKTGIDCGDCFPSHVTVETKFGTPGGFPDWEANVEVGVNGVNCGNTHIVVDDYGVVHEYSYVQISGCDYPYPANFEATFKREIDSSSFGDRQLITKAVDQYGVQWKIREEDKDLTIENLSFPENDKIMFTKGNTDRDGQDWFLINSDLGRNHLSTYALHYKTGSNVNKEYTHKVTVRFVFPLKLKIMMDDQLVTTQKGYQSDCIDIDPIDVKPGYYLSKYKKSGSSGTIEFDELTGKYKYYFGVENDTLTAVLKPITYTIAFDKNGDDVTGNVTSRTVTYDKKFTFPLNYFKRKGYKFVGWNSEPDGSGMAFENKATTINLTDKRGDKITFYAQWESEDGTMTGSLISNGVIVLVAGIAVFVIAVAACVVTALITKKRTTKD